MSRFYLRRVTNGGFWLGWIDHFLQVSEDFNRNTVLVRNNSCFNQSAEQSEGAFITQKRAENLLTHSSAKLALISASFGNKMK